jgi:hypothetical protein
MSPKIQAILEIIIKKQAAFFSIWGNGQYCQNPQIAISG